MAKRNFAVYLAVIVFGLTTQASRAEILPVIVDGCGELARVIYSEVSSAAHYGPGKSGPWVIESGLGDHSVCMHVASTTSRAFTSAMKSAGFDVTWPTSPGHSGDFCLSGFLSQCYPDRGGFEFPGSTGNSLFVQKSWTVVSQSVMRHMHNPFSSDEIRFRKNDLKLRLGLTLRTVDRMEGRETNQIN